MLIIKTAEDRERCTSCYGNIIVELTMEEVVAPAAWIQPVRIVHGLLPAKHYIPAVGTLWDQVGVRHAAAALVPAPFGLVGGEGTTPQKALGHTGGRRSVKVTHATQHPRQKLPRRSPAPEPGAGYRTP